jgi:CRISPR-associated endonuclease Cas1
MADSASYPHPSIDLKSWDESEHDTGVLIADGSNIRVMVRGGQLTIIDGPPGQPRTRRVGRIPRTVSRILILAGHGMITAEAIRWLTWARISWAMLDTQGTGIAASSGPQRTDSRLLRSQAYAALEETGLRTTAYLLNTKISGQASVLRDVFRSHDAARLLDGYAEAVTYAPSLDEMRGLEGNAACAYWSVWAEQVRIPWRPSDAKIVPAHWTRFTSRSSLVWDYPLNMAASDPANAMLNYLYTVAETEARHACHAIGLHPALGILHADKPGRDSMALDLIEAIRPDCDRIILRLLDTGLGAEPLDRRHFSESYQGQVWLIPPRTHDLASYAAQIGALIRPHAEHAARIIAGAAGGYVKIPRARKSAARRTVTESGRPIKRASVLRPGVTARDIVPDSVWTAILPLIPVAPRSRSGRPSPDSREIIAGLAAHELLGISWAAIGLPVSTSTYRARLLEYQWAVTDGLSAWDRISAAIQAGGHLSALLSAA